jgi:hypothetical protein
MNDDDVLARARESVSVTRAALAGMRMEHPVQAIMAAGRARRVRRLRKGLSGTAAAAAVVTLALVLPLGAKGAAAPTVHVNLAAWSVNTSPDGTVTFTMRNISDPTRLQHVLAEAGVSAMVRYGEICWPDRAPLPALGIVAPKALSPGPLASPLPAAQAEEKVLMSVVWVIHPSKMPPGTRFIISEITPAQVRPGHVEGGFILAPDSATVTCSTTPPAGDAWLGYLVPTVFPRSSVPGPMGAPTPSPSPAPVRCVSPAPTATAPPARVPPTPAWCISPTPTPSPTSPAPTPTSPAPTPSRSATPTPSRSATPTPSRSAAPTPSRSAAAAPTPAP